MSGERGTSPDPISRVAHATNQIMGVTTNGEWMRNSEATLPLLASARMLAWAGMGLLVLLLGVLLVLTLWIRYRGDRKQTPLMAEELIRRAGDLEE